MLLDSSIERRVLRDIASWIEVRDSLLGGGGRRLGMTPGYLAQPAEGAGVWAVGDRGREAKGVLPSTVGMMGLEGRGRNDDLT
jgi:hypothetical protein